MSLLNKKPFIKKILEETSDSDLAILNHILDGTTERLFKSFVNDDYAITNSDKGVHHCVLEVEDNIFTGYLLFNNLHCVLVCYDGKSQAMKSIVLDYTHNTYEIVEEELTILEFRTLVQGVTKFETSKIDEMTDEELDAIKCGDIIVKKTVEGDNTYSHAYLCTYKEDKVGICLSYFDASYTETISYDYTDGHWVFNSKDTN